MEKLNRKTFYKPDPAIIEKMRMVYMNCPKAVNYVKKLGIPAELIESHIDIFYDFAKDLNYCDKCPGIDECIKENPLLCTKVTYNDGFVERQLTPCKKLLEKMHLKNQFIVMDFSEDWLTSQISKINKNAARKIAIKKYLDYIKNGNLTWLYLNGEQNTGRSFLAANMAIDAAKKEHGPVAFVNCASRFKQLADQNYRNPELFQKTLSMYCTVPILVLDDFGNEYKNDFIRDGILFEILSKRASDKLFTIFTSDFSIEDVVALYSTTKSATIRAKQIGKIIKNNAEKEINLGEISIY